MGKGAALPPGRPLSSRVIHHSRERQMLPLDWSNRPIACRPDNRRHEPCCGAQLQRLHSYSQTRPPCPPNRHAVCSTAIQRGSRPNARRCERPSHRFVSSRIRGRLLQSPMPRGRKHYRGRILQSSGNPRKCSFWVITERHKHRRVVVGRSRCRAVDCRARQRNRFFHLKSCSRFRP